MPKTPMDYSNCCIYKIEHIENDNLVYVGHTTNFYKRKAHHKSDCINENRKSFNFKLYQMIRENGGFEMFKMIEVEKYPCNDKREAMRREDEVMKELKADMNTYRAFLTQEEKKEVHKEYGKKYWEENKGRFSECRKEYLKQYYDIHKENISEKGKQYRFDNNEKIKEREKKYRETRKDIRKEKVKEKTTCECGCEITKINLKRHQSSKSHLELMNKI
jgi:hypothetical protein